jgi:hypothetical protein
MTTKRKFIAKKIAEEARRLLPRSILEADGRALYSPASTLTSGSPFYFLGLNPGESPGGSEIHDLLTVEKDLDRLANNQISLHGFLDEKWKNFDGGEAPIQVAGQQVFAILAGGDIGAGKELLRRTPTSNFVLRRSPSEELLKARTGEKTIDLALQCWPFHAAVLRESGCKVVITHAVGIARMFARAHHLGEGFQRPSGWGGTLSTLYAWELPEGVQLLAMPNLSRYKPDGPRTAALEAFFKEFGASL